MIEIQEGKDRIVVVENQKLMWLTGGLAFFTLIGIATFAIHDWNRVYWFAAAVAVAVWTLRQVRRTVEINLRARQIKIRRETPISYNFEIIDFDELAGGFSIEPRRPTIRRSSPVGAHALVVRLKSGTYLDLFVTTEQHRWKLEDVARRFNIAKTLAEARQGAITD